MCSMCHRALRAPCTTCSRASSAWCLRCSCAVRASCSKFSRASRASFPTSVSCPMFSQALRVWHPMCSRALGASFPTCPSVSHALCLMCFMPCASLWPFALCLTCLVPICRHALWTLFPYVPLVPRASSTLYANITFYALEFACLTFVIFFSEGGAGAIYPS